MRILSVLLLFISTFVIAAPQTQQFTDDTGRTVTVPLHPKRIVSLHDLDITIPLIELGFSRSAVMAGRYRMAVIHCVPHGC